MALHPGGQNTEYDYLVARWTAGDAVDGLVNIAGSIRNFVANGDSVIFFICVDGVLKFSVDGEGATLAETYFDFDTIVRPSQSVDFVLGNGGTNNSLGDESLLRAVISANYRPPIESLVDLDYEE